MSIAHAACAVGFIGGAVTVQAPCNSEHSPPPACCGNNVAAMAGERVFDISSPLPIVTTPDAAASCDALRAAVTEWTSHGKCAIFLRCLRPEAQESTGGGRDDAHPPLMSPAAVVALQLARLLATQAVSAGAVLAASCYVVAPAAATQARTQACSGSVARDVAEPPPLSAATCLLTGVGDLAAVGYAPFDGVVPRAAFVNCPDEPSAVAFIDTLAGTLLERASSNRQAPGDGHLFVDLLVKRIVEGTPKDVIAQRVQLVVCESEEALEGQRVLARAPHTSVIPEQQRALLGPALGGCDWQTTVLTILGSGSGGSGGSGNAATIARDATLLEAAHEASRCVSALRSASAKGIGLRRLCCEIRSALDAAGSAPGGKERHCDLLALLRYLEQQLDESFARDGGPTSGSSGGGETLEKCDAVLPPGTRASGPPAPSPPIAVTVSSWRKQHSESPTRSPSASRAASQQQQQQQQQQPHHRHHHHRYCMSPPPGGATAAVCETDLEAARRISREAEGVVAAATQREEQLRRELSALRSELSVTRAELATAQRLIATGAEREDALRAEHTALVARAKDAAVAERQLVRASARVAELEAENAKLRAQARAYEDMLPPPPLSSGSPSGAALPEVQRDARQRDKITHLRAELEVATTRAELLDARAVEAAEQVVAREREIAFLKEEVRMVRGLLAEHQARSGEQRGSPSKTADGPLGAPRRSQPQSSPSPTRTSPRAAAAAAVAPISRSQRRADTPPKVTGLTPRPARRLESASAAAPPAPQQPRRSPVRQSPVAPCSAAATRGAASPSLGSVRPTPPRAGAAPSQAERRSAARQLTPSHSRGSVGDCSTGSRARRTTPSSTRAAPTAEAPPGAAAATSASRARPPRVASPAKVRKFLASAGFMQPTTAAATRQAETTKETRPMRFSSPTALERVRAKEHAAHGVRGAGVAAAPTVERTNSSTRRPVLQSGNVAGAAALRPRLVTPVRSTAPPTTQMAHATTYRPTRMVRHHEWEGPH